MKTPIVASVYAKIIAISEVRSSGVVARHFFLVNCMTSDRQSLDLVVSPAFINKLTVGLVYSISYDQNIANDTEYRLETGGTDKHKSSDNSFRNGILIDPETAEFDLGFRLTDANRIAYKNASVVAKALSILEDDEPEEDDVVDTSVITTKSAKPKKPAKSEPVISDPF